MKIKYHARKDWPENAVVWQRRVKRHDARRAYNDDSKFAFCKTLYAARKIAKALNKL